MFAAAIVPVMGVNPENRIHGKSPVEWTLIQAFYSKWINRTYILAEDMDPWRELSEKHGAVVFQKKATGTRDVVECILEGIARAEQDQPINVAVYLDPGRCARKPDGIDTAIEHFRVNPAIPLATSLPIAGASVFVIDKMRFLSLYTRDGKLIPAEEQGKIEIELHPGIDQVGEMTTEQYADYFNAAMSETGYRQNAGMYNRGVEQNLMPSDYMNSFINHLSLNLEHGLEGDEKVEEYALVKKLRGDPKVQLIKKWKAHTARDLREAFVADRGPAIVIGSGQSLDDALPLLKDWKGATFCSTSHASSMVYHGCDPTYIVGYDINSAPEEIPIADAWELHDTTLITHPGINPALVNFWQGRKLLFREMDSANNFMSQVLPIAYGNIIPSIMYLFSCSVAAEMSLAKGLGYSPIFLVGCDFRNTRWTNILYKDGEWKRFPPSPPAAHERFILCDNGEWSRPLNVFYKRSVLCVWDIDGSQCIMTSPRSIITEMPRVDIHQVIEQQGKGFESEYLTRPQVEDRAERYLARVNQFLVRIGDGKRVVETADSDWEKSVQGYMLSLQNALKQRGKEKDLDIEANMARFKALKGGK